MMIAVVLIALFGMLIFGAPIYIALSLSTFAGLMLFTDTNPMIVLQRTFGGIDKFVLMCLPLYILCADGMDMGGLARRMIRFCKSVIGHFKGGMAMTTQIAAMFFGALSGSSPATVAAIGRILYPQLVKDGYNKSFASGLIIQSGAVSLLLPPGITLVLYAAATNVSVGALYAAGMSSGLFYGFFVLLYIWWYAKKNKLNAAVRVKTKEFIEATKQTFSTILVSMLVIGGIFIGWFTPTEAAGVAAVYTLIVGMFVYKEITWKKLYELCVRSATTSAQVMILIAGASSFAWILTVGQVPQQMASWLTTNFTTSLTFLLFLNVILLLIGMFLDSTLALIVLAPLLLSTAVGLGIDPIHLGIIIVMNLAIGTFTPPFGLNIFVSRSITGLSLVEILPGLWKFIWISIVSLLFITYVPWLTMWLPNLLGY